MYRLHPELLAPNLRTIAPRYYFIQDLMAGLADQPTPKPGAVGSTRLFNAAGWAEVSPRCNTGWAQ
jgi:hypothetical protein